MERIETVIVGGGQAGLATSYFLKQGRREHILLEQAAQAGSAWRTGRWDSFTLVTPNWTVRMPGAEYSGPDPEGFLPRDEIVAYFEHYADRFHLPIQYSTRVLSIEQLDGRGYRVDTDAGAYEADNVVMATGYEQLPKIPPFAANLPSHIVKLHSSTYRNPQSLPSGAVLVVGSAQSGCQIAEELYQAGRQVYLSTGASSGRVPRRYRGQDTFKWLYQLGFFDTTPDKLPVPREHFAAPHVSGKNGGHTLNLHQFARDGVTLLGHLRGASGHKLSLAPDLHENLGRVDGFEMQARKMIDGYIQARGLDAPLEDLPQLRYGYGQPIIEELDLKATGINTIVWAGGYTFDASLLKLPVMGTDGFPIQTNGAANYPGLYFAGMPWMPTLKTGTLAGVGESARHIAESIALVGVN
jgi:putative flavoprotein involved in K+ transport